MKNASMLAACLAVSSALAATSGCVDTDDHYAFDPSSPGLASGCYGEPPQDRLEGRVYSVPIETRHIPDLSALPLEGTICMDHLYLPERRDFPGLGGRKEWFAIEFRGTFDVSAPGVFQFRLTADDGARLYIDGAPVIDDDGFHVPLSKEGTVQLAAGRHTILVPYWQGPGPLALILEVARPGEPYQIFHTDRPLIGIVPQPTETPQ